LRLAWYHRFDHLQALLVAVLVGLGLMTLFSASRAEFGSQLAGLGLGAGVYVALSVLDYHRLRAAAPYLYALGLLSLLFVEAAGHTAYGAQRWVRVGGVQVQPSELAKLFVLLMLASYLADRDRPGLREMLVCAAIGIPPAVLVLLQPDLGTAIVFGALLLGVLFLAGAPRLPLSAVFAGGLGLLPVLPHVLHGYQRKRLETFLDPTTDPLGAGYNLIQARIAIGSGGVFGQGWLHGSQGRLGYVPERTSDFVFAVFAEQFGLAGGLLLLALFAVLLLRLLRSAAVAPDGFGRLLCLGAAVVFLTQVVQNVGMNVGLTPVAGIPLPFISHGSSALVTELALLGVVQSVMLRRRLVVHEPAAAPDRLMVNDSGTVRLSF
jgi:rod shape determining protein RodA